ncbi:non-heme iron oxygenase ferredoxin subunit [Amycolatopsis saalfeldensis]|uniref:3-phenylpropionate/trans-cinnamate dioxygenase ferredoxin subunit n=1 Tax=Amycolatopsis saalfeldensis TaxID=394193 RepID=A0A1H8YP10_9PSEU|nr:non-heme iron oxygenase ferredoxin subunit [Amycolatopsis saalfeldensis]SEP53920.1 3-phenylpropionate/trans-cinnamate dioxygenase ferredoxin subunit [Amycolatopsis saalfeldensis]
MTTNTTWHRVGALADLPVGDAVRVETPDGEVAVFHTETGIRAIANRCTHGDAELREGYLDGETVECPAHFGTFCLRTGEALAYPAIEPVATWQIQVDDGQIYLGGRTSGGSD